MSHSIGLVIGAFLLALALMQGGQRESAQCLPADAWVKICR